MLVLLRCSEYVTLSYCLFCSSSYLLVPFLPFSVARHVYGYTKVLDGDGDPFRPDNYGPQDV